MIKVLGWIIVITICIFALFGFLILIEYLRYYKRKIVLRLRSKLVQDTSELCQETTADD